MNQILITEKIYVTPELKKKKKLYQFAFIISILCISMLSSYYIYAEYDRNKNEEISQEILSEIDDTTVNRDDGILTVILSQDNQSQVAAEPSIEDEGTQNENEKQKNTQYTAKDGKTYTVEATLNIPALGINYPVLSETSEELLKVSLNKFWGPTPNEVGNYCIVGHNYTNKKMFGKLADINSGDVVELTDVSGRKISYKVYDKKVVYPDDVACTSQLTGGKKEVTLITCTNHGTQRLVVKAREV